MGCARMMSSDGMAKAERAAGQETILLLFFRRSGFVFLPGFVSRTNASNFHVH